MEFMTGVKKKEDISVKTLLEIPEGTEVKLEGAVHIIRDMGEVAFVILRKSEGLVQCVYEEGSVDFPLKDLKEESAVAVTGTVEKRGPRTGRRRSQAADHHRSFRADRANAARSQQMENEHLP